MTLSQAKAKQGKPSQVKGFASLRHCPCCEKEEGKDTGKGEGGTSLPTYLPTYLPHPPALNIEFRRILKDASCYFEEFGGLRLRVGLGGLILGDQILWVIGPTFISLQIKDDHILLVILNHGNPNKVSQATSKVWFV